jgi:hypothetical protein
LLHPSWSYRIAATVLMTVSIRTVSAPVLGSGPKLSLASLVAAELTATDL